MSYNIPFEMQVEIMKRLPVKSLAMFRSVSKVWKSVIDSRLFVADYTNMRQHHRLLIKYNVDTSLKTEIKYVSVMDDDAFSQHPVTNLPLSFEPLLKQVLVGTSQGLVCLSGIYREDDCYKKTAVIWNPLLGKSIAIDVPRQQGHSDLAFSVRPDNFDPVIVMGSMEIKDGYPVLLFALSSRVWRVPRGNLPSNSINISYSSHHVAIDRCIYWKAHERSINLVAAFDMVSEDFMEINLPHSVANRKSYDFSVSKIRDSLGLIEYCDEPEKGVCGVWMMTDDGVSKSFTKLFTINPPDVSLQMEVLEFRKNGQPIMETKRQENWVTSLKVYEPHTGTIKNLGINGDYASFYMSSYTETLLLLDQLDGQYVKLQLQL